MHDVQYDLPSIAALFAFEGEFLKGERYGSGHINDTFALTFSTPDGSRRQLLQRVNHEVFRQVPQLMENVQRVTAHAQRKLEDQGVRNIDRRVMTINPSKDGEAYARDKEGNFWRSYVFIENARTYDRIETEQQAFEAARAFGQFQAMLVDLPGGRLNETIPNFHNTPSRYATLQAAIAEDAKGRAAGVQKEIDFFRSREKLTSKLLDLHSRGELPERTTHNDCKLNNVMIDDADQTGICVIDLDTVMPGFSLYDFGDMIRTATSPALEDEPDVSKVRMQMPMFEALVRGFLEGASGFLVPAEIDNMAFSGKLITMEIGIRFLTDYLQGDVYFKTHRPGHNLDRCRTQIALVESIEAQEEEMNRLVEKIRCAS